MDVEIIDDDLVEATEVFRVEISSSSVRISGTNPQIFTILDQDRK